MKLIKKINLIYESSYKYSTGQNIELADTVKLKPDVKAFSDRNNSLLNNSLLSDYQLWFVKAIIPGGKNIYLTPIDRVDDLLDIVVSVDDVIFYER
jgi:hypothetical protein